MNIVSNKFLRARHLIRTLALSAAIASGGAGKAIVQETPKPEPDVPTATQVEEEQPSETTDKLSPAAKVGLGILGGAAYGVLRAVLESRKGANSAPVSEELKEDKE